MLNEDIDWFARQQTTCISPFELNNEGNGKALVLRYAGCNLRCPLCYAWKYAWFMRNGYSYDIQSSINALRNNLPQLLAGKKIVWVRIQGGEPCLTFNRILNTITFAIESLNIIHINGLNYFKTVRAVIQTNVITFSKLTNNQIRQTLLHLQNSINNLDNGKLIFEVSFKSPNDQSYLVPQIKGYEVLLKRIIIPLWHEGFDNIAIYPLSGLGPSIDRHNLFIIPIDPNCLPNEIPLFHHSTWDQRFKRLVDDFIHNIVPNYNAYKDFKSNHRTSGGKKLAIEELEPTPFQTSWISGYAARYSGLGIDIIPISRVLRKLTNDIPVNPQWKKWYNSWKSRMLFGRSSLWNRVLNQIPVSTNPNNLLSMVQQMTDYFYPSHPIGHYPYL